MSSRRCWRSGANGNDAPDGRRGGGGRAGRRGDRDEVLPGRLRDYHQARQDAGDPGGPGSGEGNPCHPRPRHARLRLPRRGVRPGGLDVAAVDHRSHRRDEELRPPHSLLGRADRSRGGRAGDDGGGLQPGERGALLGAEGRGRLGKRQAHSRLDVRRDEGRVPDPLEPEHPARRRFLGGIRAPRGRDLSAARLRRLLRLLHRGGGQGGDLRGGRPQGLGRCAHEDSHRGGGRQAHRF